MKRFYISTLVTLFTLASSQALANDLMNYGELSLSYSYSSDSQVIDYLSPYISTPDNGPGYWGERTANVKTNNNNLSLNLSTDFGKYFFGGFATRKVRSETTLTQNGSTDRSKYNGSTTELFIGGAYHIDENTHLFGMATHITYRQDAFMDIGMIDRASTSDTDMIYRAGAKKAWGNFVGSMDFVLNDDEHPLTLIGKYYFSRDIFAGANLLLTDLNTVTGFTVGYTF